MGSLNPLQDGQRVPVEWVDAQEWAAIEQVLASTLTKPSAGLCKDLGGSQGEVLHIDKDWAIASSMHSKGDTGSQAGAIEDSETSREQAKRSCRRLPIWAQAKEAQPWVQWQMASAQCQVKLKCKPRLLQFKGRIVYSKTESEVEMAANELSEIVKAKRDIMIGTVPIGFDTEWKVTFQQGEAPRRVAVVQLCAEGSRCDVMHIAHSGIPPSLATILQDPSTLKVGVGAFGDAAKMQRDYQISTQGVVDLSALANQKLGTGSSNSAHTYKQWSLSSLTEELICKQVEKVGRIRTGDWEECPLSDEQLLYAATDAFASLYLYQVLETFPDRVTKQEPDGNSGLNKE